MSESDLHYPTPFIEALQAIWGDGFLSPGGPPEIAAMLERADLSGRRILDLGCGIGGISCLLVEVHGAAHVTAIDIEPQLIAHASQRFADAGLQGRADVVLVEPGPLPFEAGTFDVVFSKDAMLHIPDKLGLYQDVLRVLAPEGQLVASDWLRGGDDESPPHEVLVRWGEQNGLVADFATPAMTERAMVTAGFLDVHVRDRNAWYRDEIGKEEQMVTGPGFQHLSAVIGLERATMRLESFSIRKEAVDAGILRPCHLFGRKPSAP